ncbi:Fe-S cluster assembly protein SufD [Parapedobacter lycopersici]|uniref:Fe-S cluster assembly protein SufD n=1 Tax=Parapedobacter lycopersici TaxID=1864939 RepID=UPI00333F2773
MITQVTESLYNQLTRAYEEDRAVQAPHPLGELRKLAFERFKQTGFPTVKWEDWKYTNTQPLLNQPYTLAGADQPLHADLALAAIPGLDAYRIVLVDGVFSEALSDSVPVAGLTVLPMEKAIDELAFTKHFAEYADKTDNPFVALNTALFKSGVFISLAPDAVLDKPVHIIHVAAAETPLFAQVRNLYVVGRHAEMEIIESLVTEGGATQYLNNHVSEIVVHEGGKLQHYALQVAGESGNYLNHIEVYQEKHSLYNNYNCSFPGASFVRNNINVRLDASEVESHLYGIALTAGNQFVDNHTIVDHLKPHCESYEWYKNITQDTSTAVFNGKIFVREDAQKTNAFQQNNNMLIGEQSAVYTKPQLEIFADDVKCSHGCTIGQFDPEALFYLRARGISEAQARVLLVHAFAFDVTSRFANDTVRKYVEHLVEEGL